MIVRITADSVPEVPVGSIGILGPGDRVLFTSGDYWYFEPGEYEPAEDLPLQNLWDHYQGDWYKIQELLAS